VLSALVQAVDNPFTGQLFSVAFYKCTVNFFKVNFRSPICICYESPVPIVHRESKNKTRFLDYLLAKRRSIFKKFSHADSQELSWCILTEIFYLTLSAASGGLYGVTMHQKHPVA